MELAGLVSFSHAESIIPDRSGAKEGVMKVVEHSDCVAIVQIAERECTCVSSGLQNSSFGPCMAIELQWSIAMQLGI